MRKRRVLFVVACLVAGLAVGFFFLHDPEPRYKGRKLSDWIYAYGYYGVPTPQADECEEAFRQIGTNALPNLLKWIRYEWAPWRPTLYLALPRRIAHWATYSPSRNRATVAVEVFRALGPTASNAVPELTQILRRSSPRGDRAERVKLALMYINTPEAEAVFLEFSPHAIAAQIPTNAPAQVKPP